MKIVSIRETACQSCGSQKPCVLNCTGGVALQAVDMNLTHDLVAEHCSPTHISAGKDDTVLQLGILVNKATVADDDILSKPNTAFDEAVVSNHH